MDSDSTEGLARQAQAGGAAAYEALFERVAERLLVYVRCRLGPELRARLDPMDVLQEVSLRAHRYFAGFDPRGPGAFTAWIFRIADNTIRDLSDHHRAQRRRPAVGIVTAASSLGLVRADQTGPATASERSEAHDQLVGAIDALEADERHAILLRFFRGETLEGIATDMALSERSVRRLLARAQVKLGGLLEPGGDLADRP